MKCLFLLMALSCFAFQIQLGPEVLSVELADTHETRAKGLMGRKNLNDNEGMLFVFPKKEILSFWMKNTLIPLSIGFFDEEQNLIEILDMEVPNSRHPKTYKSHYPSLYALEVPRGWFAKHEI